MIKDILALNRIQAEAPLVEIVEVSLQTFKLSHQFKLENLGVVVIHVVIANNKRSSYQDNSHKAHKSNSMISSTMQQTNNHSTTNKLSNPLEVLHLMQLRRRKTRIGINILTVIVITIRSSKATITQILYNFLAK